MRISSWRGGYKVYGCDLSPSSVIQAISNHEQLYGRTYAGSIYDFPYQDKKFDVVYCVRSSWYMQHFPDEEMQEMLKLTKDNGYVVFDIINRESPENRISVLRHIRNFFVGILQRGYHTAQVLFLNKSYAPPLKNYLFSMDIILQSLDKDYEVKIYSPNQMLDGLDAPFDSRGQKLLFVVHKTKV